MRGPYATLFAQEAVEQPPAAKAEPKDAIKSDSLWITIGLLCLVLVLGAVILAAVDRWRKRATVFEKESVEELSRLRDLFESGEITHSEYDRILGKMAGRVKEKVGVKPGGSETGPGTPSINGTPPGNPNGSGK